MAYRYDERESRYGGPIDDGVITDQEIIDQIQTVIPDKRLDETSPTQLTADVNNFSLADAILTRFSSNAARTITGFAGAKAGVKIVANVGSFNVVLANNSASSDAENRILTHSGANITLTPGQLALMTYDFTSARWRAGQLT
jgi:hypothetical protein